MARRAKGFGMRVLAHDPMVPPQALEAAEVLPAPDLDAAVAEADVVSLHLPLTEKTRGLFSSERLARMKRGSILINCARPGLVDEMALADAVESGALGGAGLDTFDQALAISEASRFNSNRRILRSPYVAALAVESVARTSVLTAAAVIAARDGRLEARLLANPDVLGSA
jgi:phosphoglycerate dehydrogenase-like enzyme